MWKALLKPKGPTINNNPDEICGKKANIPVNPTPFQLELSI